jgi:hypothetical protein
MKEPLFRSLSLMSDAEVSNTYCRRLLRCKMPVSLHVSAGPGRPQGPARKI